MKTMTLTITARAAHFGEAAAEIRQFMRALAADPGFFERLEGNGRAGRELVHVLENRGRRKDLKLKTLVADTLPRLSCDATLEG